MLVAKMAQFFHQTAALYISEAMSHNGSRQHDKATVDESD